MRLLIAIISAAALSYAGDYTQRGFIENRITIYPQGAPNDPARVIGEELFRYEGFFKASTQFQLAGSVDVRMDSHRQVERRFSSSWSDRQPQRPILAIRRLGALYSKGPATLELGKQFVRWGKTDILTPTDRFAPRDFLTVIDNEFLPITAARLTLEKGANTVDVVWTPTFTPSRIPLYHQRWSSIPPQLPIRDDGAAFPGGSQGGIRWSRTGMVEYAFSLYRGSSHLPSIETSYEPMPGNFRVALKRIYPQMTMVGGDVAVPLTWLTLKGEAAHFGSDESRADAYALFVIQVERQSGEWFFVGGYAGETTTRNGTQPQTFAPDRELARTALGRAGYTIDSNRNIAVEGAVRQDGDGAWMKVEYSQAFGQHWRATLNTILIWGDIENFLGQYRRNSNASIIVRYSF